MPARRLNGPAHPVTVTLDGRELVAEEGEPLAASLVAAGALSLARSPKFHRPRGPSCFRSACDGCLARVDDAPNVMTCRVRARAGMHVTTQNSLGSRKVDLLRVTDWFFPEGMNHHELFAGVPGVQTVMQAFARRVAGLGRLPGGESGTLPAASRRHEDVCVVGSGPSGMATALAFLRRGRKVRLIDDGVEVGGVAVAFGRDRGPFGPLLAEVHEAVRAGDLTLSLETCAGAFFGADLLVVGEHAEIVTADTFVLAVGAHDGTWAFEGNDVPGVVSARAAATMLASGVLVGDTIVLARPSGGTELGASFAARARAAGADVLEIDELPCEAIASVGSSEVSEVAVMRDGERVLFDADALVTDFPPCPSHELAVQAGAKVRHEAHGYVVLADTDGRIAPGVLGVGEMVGTAVTLEAVRAEAERVAGA